MLKALKIIFIGVLTLFIFLAILIFADWAYLSYLSTIPEDREGLGAKIEQADMLIITPFNRNEVYYVSTNKEDFKEFNEVLQIEIPNQAISSSLFCLPASVIRFYSNGKEFLAISNYSGSSVQISEWSNNVDILDKEKYLSWYEKRGLGKYAKYGCGSEEINENKTE